MVATTAYLFFISSTNCHRINVYIGVVLLGLHQDVVELGVGSLEVPGILLQLLQGVDALVQKFVEPFALVFVFVPLLLELLELDGEVLVVLELELVLLFDFPVGGHERLDFVFPIVAHPFESGVFPDGVVDLDGDLVDLDFEVVDFVSEF